MQKTLVFTDIHITDVDQDIIELDPLARFEQVLHHAVTHHPDADRVVLLGDLTHHGHVSQYLRLKPALDACPFPIELTIGNHDNRAAFNRVFHPAAPADKFVQSCWTDPFGTLFLLLDTVDEDGLAPKHGGVLSGDQLRWITQQIDDHAPKSLVVMMHHPPFLTGFTGMDRIRLQNGDVLIDLLLETGLPCQLICGHVHRTISGNIRSIPFALLKSPCHQQPMDLANSSSAQSIDEPGAYGILLSHRDGVILHTEDVFDAPRKVLRDTHSKGDLES